ncbi:MAG: SRPBCC domain-containing protein [Chitinophagaceae bacterium]|nr:SRPBCC domain-containing protein [Chitinophagaceae bacterium]
MQRLMYHIAIAAAPERVWFVLWNDYTYRQWTSVFGEGSYAVSTWEAGSRVHFLLPDGRGMYARIAEHVPGVKMVIEHLGPILNFQEQAPDPSLAKVCESYMLEKQDGKVLLQASVDAEESFVPFFNERFPLALERVRQMAEDFRITITASVNAPVAQVWDAFTEPAHIVHWNQASPDWHTPQARLDLTPGGSFCYRMEARDGSAGFDFTGTFESIIPHQHISYHMDDGRRVSVSFSSSGTGTLITESFDPENIHSLELQYEGWLSILRNFKSYSETIRNKT